MARKGSARLSHGGRYYQVHREREQRRKRYETARWQGLYKAFLDRNPDLSMNLPEFKAEVRRTSPDHRAHLPTHTPNLNEEKRAVRLSRREQRLRRETTNRLLGTDYSEEEFETRYGGRR